jgi:hypothetical protein
LLVSYYFSRIRDWRALALLPSRLAAGSPPGNVAQLGLRACQLAYGGDSSADLACMAWFGQRAEILLSF